MVLKIRLLNQVINVADLLTLDHILLLFLIFGDDGKSSVQLIWLSYCCVFRLRLCYIVLAEPSLINLLDTLFSVIVWLEFHLRLINDWSSRCGIQSLMWLYHLLHTRWRLHRLVQVLLNLRLHNLLNLRLQRANQHGSILSRDGLCHFKRRRRSGLIQLLRLVQKLGLHDRYLKVLPGVTIKLCLGLRVELLNHWEELLLILGLTWV